MLWCPKCKVEYREGFKLCSTCGRTLVEQLPQEPEAQEMNAGEPVLLTHSNNNLTLQMMDGALRDANIPFYYREMGVGSSYSPYMNATTGGVDIYVPEKLLGSAQDVIGAFASVSQEIPDRPIQRSAEITDEEVARSKQARMRIWVWVSISISLASLILGLLYMLHVFK